MKNFTVTPSHGWQVANKAVPNEEILRAIRGMSGQTELFLKEVGEYVSPDEFNQFRLAEAGVAESILEFTRNNNIDTWDQLFYLIERGLGYVDTTSPIEIYAGTATAAHLMSLAHVETGPVGPWPTVVYQFARDYWNGITGLGQSEINAIFNGYRTASETLSSDGAVRGVDWFLNTTRKYVGTTPLETWGRDEYRPKGPIGKAIFGNRRRFRVPRPMPMQTAAAAFDLAVEIIETAGAVRETFSAISYSISKVMGTDDDALIMYVTQDDDRVRPNHARLNGKVFKKSSALGKNPVMWAPNGFRCRCSNQSVPITMRRDATVSRRVPSGASQDRGFDFNPNDETIPVQVRRRNEERIRDARREAGRES